jgi:carboxylesterase type B
VGSANGVWQCLSGCSLRDVQASDHVALTFVGAIDLGQAGHRTLIYILLFELATSDHTTNLTLQYNMSPPDGKTPGPTARLSQGLVIGTTLEGEYPHAIEAFRGIPYALPPTGDRRFRPPVTVPKGEDIIDATKFGPRAPAKQFVVVGPTLEESEDCLTVNVFRQARHSDASKLPVAVYFHGGAFNRGNAAMHDTASMVGWSELPFIGISFGYRIGALGFLPSKLSAKEGALNLGLKDQICLLEWVEENVHHFGGNKNNVTLIGLSVSRCL